jgi:biotin carboxylase
MYYEAARSLDLLPIPIKSHASGKNKVSESECLQVSSMDVGAILSAIDRIGRARIAGVFAGGSARAELAARLAAALDRPHADPETISLCNDKRRLREFLAHKGLNTVAFEYITTTSDAYSAARRLGGAVVVKPLFSTGSDGARVCRTSDEAVLHARRLLKRKSQGVLIEKYIDAPQFSVEIFDGIPLNVESIYISEGPYPIITGVEAPAPLERERFTEIKNYAASIAKEVGLLCGPAFIELRYSGVEKHIIEVNPRPSLNSPITQYIASGLNMAELCVKFSCGIPYDQEFFAKHGNRACVGRHVVRNGSSVRAIKGLEEARKVPRVKSIQVNEPNFGRRGPATCALDRIATVHSQAENIELAAASVNMAIKKLTIVYDKFPVDLFKFHFRRIYRLWTRLSNKMNS